MTGLPVNYWGTGVIPVINENKPNTTSYWSGTDSYESFKRNPREGYSETSITYTYNSYGYREEEFFQNQRPNILCMGCSHTMGVGLRLEDVWVSQIKKKFPEYNVINLGSGGASADTVVRTLVNVIDLFLPEVVFILWPVVTRFEIYTTHLVERHGPWSFNTHDYRIIEDVNMYNLFCKNKLIVNLLADKNKFKLVELEADKFPSPDFYQLLVVARARDDHWGPAAQQEIVRRFMSQYNGIDLCKTL